MSANKIAETSLSSGTGNFTLTGAWSVPNSFISGNRTFNSFYGLDHRFPYMIQDKLGNWEKGIAYLSDSLTLVRELVTDNSINTTTFINFPEGEKLVMVPTDAGSDTVPKLRPNAAYAGSAFISNNTSTCGYSAANRFIMTPLLLKRPMHIDEIGLDVSNSAASTFIRIGLYQLADVATDYSFVLVQDLGTIDSTTTGLKYLSFNKVLGAGVYFLGSVSNGAPAARGLAQTLDLGLCFTNGTVPGQGWFKTGVVGAVDTMPTPFVLTAAEMNANQSMPRFYLRGRLL